MKFLTNLKSWKTTAAAALGAVALIAGEVRDVIDDDPKTQFDWEVAKGALVILGVGFLAKDGDKSSKELGL